MKRAVAAVGLLTIAVLLAILVHDRMNRSASDPRDAELASLRERVDMLARAQQRQATLDSYRSIQLQASPAVQGPGAAPEPSAQAAPRQKEPEEFIAEQEARRAEELRARAQRRERIEQELALEPADPLWSREATAIVQGWFESPELAEYKLARLDCRTTICRVEMKVPAEEQPATFVDSISTKMGSFGSSSVGISVGPSGERAFVAYFGRAGEPLPR